MLGIIPTALEELLQAQNKPSGLENRISMFKEKFGQNKFHRKDYLQNFKNISAPTASKNLKWTVE